MPKLFITSYSFSFSMLIDYYSTYLLLIVNKKKNNFGKIKTFKPQLQKKEGKVGIVT